MTLQDCKISLHTNDTIRIQAPQDYHFESLDGTINYGNLMYEEIRTKLERKYKLVQDSNIWRK